MLLNSRFGPRFGHIQAFHGHNHEERALSQMREHGRPLLDALRQGMDPTNQVQHYSCFVNNSHEARSGKLVDTDEPVTYLATGEDAPIVSRFVQAMGDLRRAGKTAVLTETRKLLTAYVQGNPEKNAEDRASVTESLNRLLQNA